MINHVRGVDELPTCDEKLTYLGDKKRAFVICHHSVGRGTKSFVGTFFPNGTTKICAFVSDIRLPPFFYNKPVRFLTIRSIKKPSFGFPTTTTRFRVQESVNEHDKFVDSSGILNVTFSC